MAFGEARALAIGTILVVLGQGCSKQAADEHASAPKQPDALSVYTVNYPLFYFTERLAPEGVEVVFPAPAGVDPAFWKPSPESIGDHQRADLILLNGAGYARWTRYATLPKSRIIVTARGCREAFLQTAETIEHQHGPGGEHAHEGTVFTTWLDMRLALCQASRIRDALIDKLPNARTAIRENFEALESDLNELDARLHDAAKHWGDRPLLASHPVYQYLADAYGLQVESVHFEPGQTLGPANIEELQAVVARHPSRLMLWEGEPLPATRQRLREMGIATIVFDPASQPPLNGDFLTVMQANAEHLECAVGAKPCR